MTIYTSRAQAKQSPSQQRWETYGYQMRPDASRTDNSNLSPTPLTAYGRVENLSTYSSTPLRPNLPPSPTELRHEILKQVLLDAGTASNLPLLSDMSRVLSRIDSLTTSGKALSAIADALQQDLTEGDPQLTHAVKETYRQLSTTVGPQVAAALLKQLLKRYPAAAVLGVVLGPEFIPAALQDIPVLLRNFKELTGLQVQNGRLRFKWKVYRPQDERQSYRWIEVQRRWARGAASMLRQGALWLKERLVPKSIKLHH